MRKRTGYLLRRGKIWYAAWTLSGKKFMRSTGKTNRREAEVELHRIMEPFVAGDEVSTLQNIAARIEGRKAELVRLEDERNPPLRLDQAWEAYVDSATRPDSGDYTLKDYGRHLAAFAAWCKERHPAAAALRDVSAAMASEYAAHLVKRKLSGNRYNKAVSALDLVFRILKEPGRLDANPWEKIQRKQVVSQSRRELTVDELRTVIGTATGELKLLFALGIYTGLRLSDCATLRWAEVDLPRGLIRRIPSKTARRRPRPVIVPIHPVLGGMLAETPPKARGEYVLPESAVAYQKDTSRFSRRIQDHFKACGVTTHKPGTGPGTSKRAVVEVGFHSMRHSFVSLCREANAPLSVVESIVGHSSVAMTQHYSHTSEAAARAAVLSLPPVIGDTPALPPARTMIDAAAVRALAETLNAQNWKKVRAELMGL